jgi:hypothetical protein
MTAMIIAVLKRGPAEMEIISSLIAQTSWPIPILNLDLL